MQHVQSTSPYPGNVSGLESARSAVSWGAVIAGAVIASAVSAMLVIGGSGLGFLSLSPWNNEGASATTLAVSSIIWLFITQIIAYALAGYIAGRLRTKWTDLSADEVYFRDTAHGFLVWAVSAVIGIALMASALASVVSGTAKAGASVVEAGVGAIVTTTGSAVQSNPHQSSLAYFTDILMRPDSRNIAVSPRADVREEASRILARSLMSGEVTQPDQEYMVELIAREAGVDKATALQRLTQVQQQAIQTTEKAEQFAREAADTARKAAAQFALWAFASLLVGAFVASFSATIGGRSRDL
jgi:hypothetical protein